ncbi:MAG: patatin-like phospholipase family protein [Candidatus Omnitrophota bacterium]|jgi:NTE family protein
MELVNKNLILKEIPLFEGLSPEEFSLIEERSDIVEYKKGEVIYSQGSPPSAFYYVILGRVIIYTKDTPQATTVLEYLHRGKYFGIISLLTGDTHSVSAKAHNDCLLLIIKDADFSFTLKKIPSIAIDLSRSLSRRLKRKSLHQKTIFESTIISVFSFYPKAGKSVYALNLGLSLHKETHKSVIILEINTAHQPCSIPRRMGIADDGYRVFDMSVASLDSALLREVIIRDVFGIDLVCLRFKQDDEFYLKNLVNMLSFFTNDYHYIVLDLPASLEKSIVSTLNQSDLIHMVTRLRLWDLKRNRRLIERLGKESHFQEEKIKIIVNGIVPAPVSEEEQQVLLHHDIFATLPLVDTGISERPVLDEPNCEYSKAIRRIARYEGDCQVGLVLGVGVAYGFSHIGVLKVIEEEQIPIDIICGSSMGAIIATLWAIGNSSSSILQITREFKEPKYIWELVDFTFPFLGFIKGNKLYKFLKKYVGNKTFHDVRVPLKIVASEIKRRESKIFDKGLLIDALMATSAMPGVFAPFRFREELLLDGGITSPLPTEPLFEMGVKKIIAVNVTPSKEDILRQYQHMAALRVDPLDPQAKRKFFSLKEFFKEKFKTNILDIIFSSIEIMQSEVAKTEGQLADVVLHPDMSGLHWLAFGKSEIFAERGEQEARKHLDKVWQVINE